MDLGTTPAEANTQLNIVCPHCDTVNRVYTDRLAEALCGDCAAPLFTGHPVALTDGAVARQIARSDVPVLVDFWAPWCGPCRLMAPVFEQVAAELEPAVRLAKVNTDVERDLAVRHRIRGIPTFATFKHGSEVARISGAMDAARFMAWVRANT